MFSAPFSNRTLTITAALAGLATVAVGLLVFYSRWQYADPGQHYLLIVYLLACVGLALGIRLWSIPTLIICLFFIISTQIYSANKFSWRENYVTQAQMGQPFFLTEFIESFPTYEQYTFTFLKHPDWVRFNEQCVQPALVNQPVSARCANAQSIQDNYNIDIIGTMQMYFVKMKNTAKMVEEGKMVRRSDYAGCIANKVCATIPLLPKGVDAARMDAASQDYINIRQAFWSLINDKAMSPEVCALTPLCKALVAMKVVDQNKLPF